jgi:hypothetical protein
LNLHIGAQVVALNSALRQLDGVSDVVSRYEQSRVERLARRTMPISKCSCT